MIRTQVYLTEEQYKLVYQRAKSQNRPAAQLIREIIDIGLNKSNAVNARNAFMEIATIGKKIGATGPKNLSKNIDKYLYE